MGIKIGDIDVSNEIVELHFQVARTQLVLDAVLKKASTSIHTTPEEITAIDSKALEIVQRKFPTMGVKKKNST